MMTRRIRSKFGTSVLQASALFALCSTNGCTKKSSSSAPAPAVAPQVTAAPPQVVPTQIGGGTVERLFRYSLNSIAGDGIFCQDFISQTQVPLNDIEAVADVMAMAQAQVPAGVLNPFKPKTLGLSVKPEGCARIPELLKSGHCAVTSSADTVSGKLNLKTEQRLLWKDLAILAQASYNQGVIDSKNSAISGKNELFKTVQKQITQQQQFLNILQIGQQLTTGQQSEMIKQAQEVLSNLQNQSKQIETDIKKIEDEIVPYQDELKKTLEKLTVAREDLRKACTTSGMGATAAEWNEN